MEKIKKAGIVTGAVVGGVIGGTVSVIGKLTNTEFIDELGESIVDSTLYTGEIAGNIVSGTSDVVTGKIKSDEERVEDGKSDLKNGGHQIVGNVVNNVKTIAHNSTDIVGGIKDKDPKRLAKGVKTLAKVVAVGAITVGAIKVKKSEDEPKEHQPNSSQDSQPNSSQKKHQNSSQDKSK